MGDAYNLCHFRNGDQIHRRGIYAALPVGPSFGGGQKIPGNLLNSPKNAQALEALLSKTSIRRIAGFASCKCLLNLCKVNNSLFSAAFATWAPRLYDYYQGHISQLFMKHLTLQQNFTESVFTTCTFNFGPKTYCLPHRDFCNLSFGWCSITALGNFDPKKGGHLILFDLGLVIEFPPGSTILIPSAIFRHGNVELAPGEKRMSFTQYTAGGLFRWVDAGFQTLKNFQKEDPARKKLFDEQMKSRGQTGLNLFSTLAELKKI